MPTGAVTEQAIQDALASAMKAKDRDTVSVLKIVKTRIATEKGRRKDVDILPPEDVLKIVKKEIKEIGETLDSLRKIGAGDRVREEENKLRALEAFVPPVLSEEEIRALVLELVAEAGRDNFGRLMKEVMARVGGRADGKAVSEQVKRALS